MADLHEEVIIRLVDIRAGDTILEVYRHNTNDDAARVRRRMPVELPTEPYTAIHSVWDGSAGVAEFDAMLLPPHFNKQAKWLLDTGEKMAADELAMKISYYDVKGIPATDD